MHWDVGLAPAQPGTPRSAKFTVLQGWDREQVIEPSRTSKRQGDASFQRRAASSVSYANCL